MGISAVLYVNRDIPFAGRNKLVDIQGTFTDGITVPVDLVLAKGSVDVSAKQNSSRRHDLHINSDLEVMFIPHWRPQALRPPVCSFY